MSVEYFTAVLSVISAALAIRKSALFDEVARTTSAKPSAADIQEAVSVLQQKDLVATRKVGDEEIYAITAKGAQAAERVRSEPALSLLR